MISPMSIGKQVRSARNLRGKTQKKLAKAASCSRETISHIERGRLTPSVDLLCRLADALKVSVACLLERGTWQKKYSLSAEDYDDESSPGREQ